MHSGLVSTEDLEKLSAMIHGALQAMPRTAPPENPTSGQVYRDFKGDFHIFLTPTWSQLAMTTFSDTTAVKLAMKHRKAQSCATCGNARMNPGMGGPGDGFLECNANVLARFRVERTEVCDHFNGAHGPTAMER